MSRYERGKWQGPIPTDEQYIEALTNRRGPIRSSEVACETLAELEAALACVTPRQREALELWSNGLTGSEIGHIMGIGRVRAHCLVHAGLRRARGEVTLPTRGLNGRWEPSPTR